MEENMGHKESKSDLPLEDQKVLHQIVDLVHLSSQLSVMSDDPFDEYVYSLKKGFQDKNPQAFRIKFIKGYHLLLKEATKDC